ncbi:uncharacterized protein CC84DRAFT_1238794 [Paraphaeosphaeria sporulosa]|uniref:Uncharacterized protein n=1 Tax=Paraphaeosphaeria sporulosa TaxID=1460663 RepID=A0A177CJY2_9PLEO|nr:uncharacterized protein CC84DRAFT_1238794 [Paraphaeosphaeria sporulosa]OAG07834.1 hypothetical protein CC84DRAFT_1238794 [Paraphaeosphaeria sporulosa]
MERLTNNSGVKRSPEERSGASNPRKRKQRAALGDSAPRQADANGWQRQGRRSRSRGKAISQRASCDVEACHGWLTGSVPFALKLTTDLSLAISLPGDTLFTINKANERQSVIGTDRTNSRVRIRVGDISRIECARGHGEHRWDNYLLIVKAWKHKAPGYAASEYVAAAWFWRYSEAKVHLPKLRRWPQHKTHVLGSQYTIVHASALLGPASTAEVQGLDLTQFISFPAAKMLHIADTDKSDLAEAVRRFGSMSTKDADETSDSPDESDSEDESDTEDESDSQYESDSHDESDSEDESDSPEEPGSLDANAASNAASNDGVQHQPEVAPIQDPHDHPNANANANSGVMETGAESGTGVDGKAGGDGHVTRHGEVVRDSDVDADGEAEGDGDVVNAFPVLAG